MNDGTKKKAIVSVGVPVFNGEKFLKKRLDSILSQTLTDLELIISDNASTDNTQKICEEYAKKDDRIQYIRQSENRGPVWNFSFVLNQAKSEFFVWAAADDIWKPDFLKKNIEILSLNKNIVCSLGKVIQYDKESNNKSTVKSDLRQKYSISYFIKHLIEKILLPRTIVTRDVYSISGSYEQKVRFFLKKPVAEMLYGVCSTQVLRESMVTKSFVGQDFAVDLNILKHGDVHIIDEILMAYNSKGVLSSNLLYGAERRLNINPIKVIFFWLSYTLWCVKNLGFRIFLKNLDQFLLLNYMSVSIHLINFYIKYIKQPRFRKKMEKNKI